MNKSDLLDLILSSTCPTDYNKDTKVKTFVLDLHSNQVTIEATCEWDSKNMIGNYTIHNYKMGY